MAASSKTAVNSATSPKHRGWLTGRKLHVIPSKSPVQDEVYSTSPEKQGKKLHVIPSKSRSQDEMYSTAPAKQMKQVGKNKSEKGKMQINASSHDFGGRNTRWHISLPNLHDTQESVASPTRRPIATSPLPPPPSNPPPILNQISEKTSNPRREVKGRELVKSVSAGAVNLVTPVASQGTRSNEVMEGQSRKKEDGRMRKDPPKLPPPYSPKAKAAAVVSSAIQDHMQSSTRSAPGELQKENENENNAKLIETKKTRMKAESTENVLVVSDEIQDKQTRVSKPLKPMPYVPPETCESQLAPSIDVKSLARYFSARSKEGISSAVRPVRGRKMFFKGRKEAALKEESDSTAAKEGQSHRPPPLPSTIREEKCEVLQNVGSVVSTGSPTHMSLFSWYNLGSEPPKHALDNERFAFSERVEISKKEEKLTSPLSPYNEYLNVSVDTATLVECPSPKGNDSDVQSDREGSHKEKKPKPLPRTQSKERAMGIQRSRSQQLSTSNSEGSLSIPSPLSAHNGEYVDMTRHMELYGDKKRQDSSTSKDGDSSPGIVVQSSLDPDWQENYQEQLEREIEMEEEFCETDISTHTDESPEGVGGETFGGASTQQLLSIPVKSVLKKTQSHNPEEPNICRRNTPKEKRELRKGICSDIDEIEEAEVDDYVSMKSALKPNSASGNNTPSQGTSKSQLELSSSLTVSKPDPGADPHPYLQILPYETPPKMVKPVEQASSKSESPTHVKHYYIEIDVPGKTEPKKVGIDVSRTPTLHPKSSLAHVTTGASDVAADTKRKLKYPKIDVGQATNGPRRDERSETKSKTPYTPVKVDSETSTTRIIDGGFRPTLGKQQSGSEQDLVNRPLPPTPETAIYYKTVTNPLENIPSMRPVWHQYIEIDESELNKRSENPVLENIPKAAEGWINIHAVGGPVRVPEGKKRPLTTLHPPPVPERPSCPYVEIDGNEMEEWGTALPHISSGRNMNQSDSSTVRVKAQTSVGPKVDRKLSTPVPPAVARKPDPLRRQRSFSNSSDYSYPVIRGLKIQWSNMKRDDDKAFFTPSVPLPTVSNPARRNTAGGKKALMTTIAERSEVSDDPPSIPPKTESLLREQGRLLNLSAKPSPYLVPVTRAKSRKMSAPDIYNHLIIASESPEKSQPPREIVTSLRSELLDEKTSKAEDETPEEGDPTPLRQRKKAMNPPRPPPPYGQLLKAKEGKSHRPPKVPKKQKKVSKEKENSIPTVAITPSTNPNRVPENEENYEADVVHLHPETVTVRKGRLQHRIDRNSLEMIIRNRSAIAKQLEKESGSQRKATSEEDESVVRSLGDILLDMDALLQRRMCSEEDLIAAIEKHLNIKLVKKHRSHGDREPGGEYSQANKEALDESVEVTEQDVKDVVTFMNQNQPKSEINADGTDSEEDEVGIERGETGRNSVIIRNEVILGEGEDDTDLSPWHQSYASREAPEDGVLQSTEMKDCRSSSLGLRPLRRVKARRKSNPSTDNAIMNPSKCTIL